MFSRNIFLKIVAVFVFGIFAISFAQVTEVDTSGNGDFTAPTRDNSDSGSSSGGGNPGGYIMILQAQQKAEAEEKARQEALQQTEISRPKPQVEVKPAQEQVEISEPVIEPVPTTPIDLSASAGDTGFDGGGMGLAVLIAAILGIGAYKLSTRTPEQKEKAKQKKCMHIQGILEENIKEMTSLEERVEDMLKDKLAGKKRAKLIKKLANIKEKHEKFSKLFENCVVKKEDKKNLIIVHSNNAIETTALVMALKNLTKKDKYEIKALDITNEGALATTKPSKDTLFILTGNTTDIMNSKFGSDENYISMSSINIGEIVERLKSF